MSDTHAITSREYTVIERVIDCDGTCVQAGERQQSTVEWVGLPPQVRECIERLSVAADPPPVGVR